ncbi:DUF433 domain-containing protein [Candidatus Poribacteria bacterium]|nr:DUF433 domain-containing protein [Candidatus Poribacteria bacterium]
MHGTLVFAGTRVPVESLIQHLIAGDSLDVFLDNFPTVSREQAVAYLQMTLELLMRVLLNEHLPYRLRVLFPNTIEVGYGWISRMEG